MLMELGMRGLNEMTSKRYICNILGEYVFLSPLLWVFKKDRNKYFYIKAEC